jgi:hypothetical protein
MSRNVIQRTEMFEARLQLGGAPMDLAEYATTGLRGMAIGPSGSGKSNAGLLIAEQLAQQGWVSILIDPESELESMYGGAVKDPDDLRVHLEHRVKKMLVVSARDAAEFVPYGLAILEACDLHRKPIFVMIDEGQLFSAPRTRSDEVGTSGDIINEFVGRGRKRALDLFITALRYTGTLHRSVFSNKNLTLIGCQEDPTVWSSLAPMFKSSKIEFSDLNALAPGEFFCFSRRGVEKVKMPMAAELQRVAPKARGVKKALPTTFNQWNKAMREIPTERLNALTGPVVDLLSAVAGLSVQQISSGMTALDDERSLR